MTAANFVVKTVLGMQDDGKLSNANSIAVLYRTNAQSRAIEESCVQYNLPYVVRGSAGAFYNRAEIKDVMCFLRWLNNGRDLSSMQRAFGTPSRGIGGKSVEGFQAYCDRVRDYYTAQGAPNPPSPFELLLAMTDEAAFEPIPGTPVAADCLATRALNKFLPFSKQMNLLNHEAQTADLPDLISFLLEEFGFKSHVDSISKSAAEFEDRWNNVQELKQASLKYKGVAMQPKSAALPNASDSAAEGVLDMDDLSTPLGDFLDDIALVSDLSERNNDDEADQDEEKPLKVNLMTVHAAKGMEFDLVFVVGLEEGTFPTNRAVMEGESSTELDEERRLMYVAMTRAKNQLIMTWRREVMVFSTDATSRAVTIDKERSRFLDVLTTGNNQNSHRGGGGGGGGRGGGVKG